jgi:hypothetical protein
MNFIARIDDINFFRESSSVLCRRLRIFGSTALNEGLAGTSFAQQTSTEYTESFIGRHGLY